MKFSYRKRLALIALFCISIFIFPSQVKAQSKCEKVSEYRQHFEAFSRKYHARISQNWVTVPDEYFTFGVSRTIDIIFCIAFPPKCVYHLVSSLFIPSVTQDPVDFILSIDQKKVVVNDLLKCVRDRGAKACFYPPRRLEEFKNKYPPLIIQIALNEWDGIYQEKRKEGTDDMDHWVQLTINKVLGIEQYGACHGHFCWGTRWGNLLGLELFTAVVYSKDFEEMCGCSQTGL